MTEVRTLKERIEEELANNPTLEVFGWNTFWYESPQISVIETLESEERRQTKSSSVTVAPKEGLYTASELQEFMDSLIVGHVPRKVKTFQHIRNDLYDTSIPYPGSLRLGNFELEEMEEIKTEQKMIGKRNLKKVKIENVGVCIFPSQRAYHDYEAEVLDCRRPTNNISDGLVIAYADLERYQHGLIQRLESLGLPKK